MHVVELERLLRRGQRPIQPCPFYLDLLRNEHQAVRFIPSFGADIEVIERAELREKMAAGARAILGTPRP
jgi:predicted DNA-binding transcriptional regulator YafY